LTESVGPTTRAAIYTTSGMGNLDFTDDQQKLHQALNSIKPYTALTAAFECPNVSYYMADLIVNRNDPQALAVAAADAAACSGSGAAAAGQALARNAAINALQIGEVESKQALDVLKELVQRVTAMPG